MTGKWPIFTFAGKWVCSPWASESEALIITFYHCVSTKIFQIWSKHAKMRWHRVSTFPMRLRTLTLFSHNSRIKQDIEKILSDLESSHHYTTFQFTFQSQIWHSHDRIFLRMFEARQNGSHRRSGSHVLFCLLNTTPLPVWKSRICLNFKMLFLS